MEAANPFIFRRKFLPAEKQAIFFSSEFVEEKPFIGEVLDIALEKGLLLIGKGGGTFFTSSGTKVPNRYTSKRVNKSSGGGEAMAVAETANPWYDE